VNIKHNLLFFSVYQEKAEQGKIEMIHMVLPFCSKQVSVEPVRFASNHVRRTSIYEKLSQSTHNPITCIMLLVIPLHIIILNHRMR